MEFPWTNTQYSLLNFCIAADGDIQESCHVWGIAWGVKQPTRKTLWMLCKTPVKTSGTVSVYL